MASPEYQRAWFAKHHGYMRRYKKGKRRRPTCRALICKEPLDWRSAYYCAHHRRLILEGIGFEEKNTFPPAHHIESVGREASEW